MMIPREEIKKPEVNLDQIVGTNADGDITLGDMISDASKASYSVGFQEGVNAAYGYDVDLEKDKKDKNEKWEEPTINDKVRSIAEKLIINRNLDNTGRMGINDDNTNTNLISKHYSPLIVRKYNIINGWPMWCGIICDENLSSLDEVINSVIKACKSAGMISNNIQDIRNMSGIISETIIEYYNIKKENCVEGIALLIYCDKLAVENFYGDFMNHTSCRIEWAGLIGMLPHI